MNGPVSEPPDQSAGMRRHWLLEEGITFLNHGSFGACPRRVLERQSHIRHRLESEPVRFFVREYPGLMESSRDVLAAFLGCCPQDLVFVTNATTGVNSVLQSFPFKVGQEILVTDHEYNASRNVVDYVATERQLAVVVAPVPFPLQHAGQVLDAVMSRVSPRTRLAVLDHVTSQTGLVFPLPELVAALDARGVETLVDGAHAPGMVPLSLDALGASFYTGNCHKWLCAPKGAAFLHVRRDRQTEIRPAVISHGANAPVAETSRFRLEFDWTGTHDPTAILAVPEALGFLGTLFPGGWPELMSRNRELALHARRQLCQALSRELPCPEDMVGSLASVPLPDGPSASPLSPFATDPLQDRLFFEHSIEVPIIPWPAPPRRLIRVSAQAYNHRDEYQRLAEVLRCLV